MAMRIAPWEAIRRVPPAVLLLGLVWLPAYAQTPPSDSSPAARTPSSAHGHYRIAGKVVNALTGEPVSHATVSALTEEDSQTAASVQSDQEGHFALEALAAAKYQLAASKRGFRTASYDEHDNYSTAIVTGPGQATENLTFKLTPGATLRGVITTEGGDPVEGASVMVFKKPRPNEPGHHISRFSEDTTDDTGAYEVNALPAGEYVVAVKADPWYALHQSRQPRGIVYMDGAAAPDASAALDVAYPITFYDGTTDESSATTIALSGGGREEADITLHAVPALHLTVETPRKPDGSIARAELSETIFGTPVSAMTAGSMNAMRTGSTDFYGVAPGHYELTQGDPPRVAELDAATTQQIDAGLGTPTVMVSGTLRTASGSPLPDPMQMWMSSVDGAHQPASAPCVHGKFSVPSVAQGVWQMLAQSSSGTPLRIASIATGGRAHPGSQFVVGDHPLSLVVTVTESATRIEGFAKVPNAASNGSPPRGWHGVAGVMVVLVPSDLTTMEDLARRDQSDSDGSFSLRDVVPGQYTVVAIQDGWELDWSRPDVISRYLPGGNPVTVTANSGKVLSLSGPVPVQSR
jgi:hypothetical protein